MRGRKPLAKTLEKKQQDTDAIKGLLPMLPYIQTEEEKKDADRFSKAMDESSKLIRSSYGLSSINVSEADVFELLGLEDLPDPEYQLRNPDVEPYEKRQGRLQHKYQEHLASIKNKAVQSGKQPPSITNKSVVSKIASKVMDSLINGEISAGQALQRLERHKKEIEAKGVKLPSERTLRRWRAK